MGWLFVGVMYSSGYALVGWMLRDEPVMLGWFRAVALLVPPLVGAGVIVERRQTWRGCQWLFWSTIALGLAMSALGLTGWAAEAGRRASSNRSSPRSSSAKEPASGCR